jgi:hypothetical protein
LGKGHILQGNCEKKHFNPATITSCILSGHNGIKIDCHNKITPNPKITTENIFKHMDTEQYII